MDKKFKWDMFMTSFMPLWISIMISNIWSLVDNGIKIWNYKDNLICNICNIYKKNLVSIFVVIIIFWIMISSICAVDSFLKDKSANQSAPKIKIKKAIRAKELSSEFLLAYILPMIAFDFTKLKSVVLFVIYFSTLAFLCIRNNNVYTNIWFEFKGYKMYLCDLEAKKMGQIYPYTECLVISTNNLVTEIDNDIRCWDFDNYIYIDLN